MDPHLELLRLGAEHPDVAAEDITVTLVLDGALVTGTVISTEAWERLHLARLGEQDYDLRRVAKEALAHLDDAVEQGRRRRGPDRRFLHLRDVTVRSGQSAYALPTWRGPVAAVGGWTLGGPGRG
ncbi:hypothetical protein [Streptomyces sp. NRRL WC-3742]|uniref:hypothetical protein n=1 Tax=Streptomyces sp. NRRL WC-3742 TaxID=1463934 RepID=UPI000AF1D831|nr:hypothetical protein [Streptomyces sp. NRRL WC-3742]